MSFDQKDLETINRLFELLNKAKWDGVDGDFMVKATHTFVALRKLEEKLKQGLAKPTPVSSPVEEKKDKVKKVKTHASE